MIPFSPKKPSMIFFFITFDKFIGSGNITPKSQRLLLSQIIKKLLSNAADILPFAIILVVMIGKFYFLFSSSFCITIFLILFEK